MTKTGVEIQRLAKKDHYLIKATGNKVKTRELVCWALETPLGYGLTFEGTRAIIPEDILWWILGIGESVDIGTAWRNAELRDADWAWKRNDGDQSGEAHYQH